VKNNWLLKMANDQAGDATKALYSLGNVLRDLGWSDSEGPVQEIREMLLRIETIRAQAGRLQIAPQD
jgi:hypothetical protein